LTTLLTSATSADPARRFKAQKARETPVVIRTSLGYSAHVNQVSGTYRSGKVLLDQPVEWPDGIQVSVVCENGTDGGATDVYVNGLQWEDSADSMRRWAEWFDSLGAVFTGEEVDRFEASLRAAREEQKTLRADWQEKIDNLLR